MSDRSSGRWYQSSARPTSGSRATRYEERRRRIVDIAAGLFAANGYRATGIREIGEAASLARGALYYYIESKEALLGEIHDRVLDPLLEATSEICVLDRSAESRLRLVSKALIEQIIGQYEYVWVFLHEYRCLTGARRATFRDKRAQFEDQLIGLLASGVDDGEFEVADLRSTMLAFLGMHNYTYQWVPTDQLDPVRVSTVYCDIFFGGIHRRRAGASSHPRPG